MGIDEPAQSVDAKKDQKTYTAAMSCGIRRSQRKNPASMNMEMINGASTCAVAQPDSEPLVMAKMNRISATNMSIESASTGEESEVKGSGKRAYSPVRTDTPTKSSLRRLASRALTASTSGTCGSSCDGISTTQNNAAGTAMTVVNQKIQRYVANSTKTALIIVPNTVAQSCK